MFYFMYSDNKEENATVLSPVGKILFKLYSLKNVSIVQYSNIFLLAIVVE